MAEGEGEGGEGAHEHIGGSQGVFTGMGRRESGSRARGGGSFREAS